MTFHLFVTHRTQTNLYSPAPMSEGITKPELFLEKAAELDARARQASEHGRATFMRLAEAYRRVARRPKSIALASDAEIEAIAERMAGHSPG